jgi:hypothetical protein
VVFISSNIRKRVKRRSKTSVEVNVCRIEKKTQIPAIMTLMIRAAQITRNTEDNRSAIE